MLFPVKASISRKLELKKITYFMEGGRRRRSLTSELFICVESKITKCRIFCRERVSKVTLWIEGRDVEEVLTIDSDEKERMAATSAEEAMTFPNLIC